MKKVLSILITVIMLFGIMSVCGNVFAATVIGLNEEASVDITYGGEVVYFNFTPAESGNYIIRSFENDYDTYGYLYYGSEQLAYNDDGGPNQNFRMFYYLEAGNTYEIRARFYSSSRVGGFKIIVERNPLESISYNPIGQLTVTEGTSEYPDMMGDNVTLTLNDGMEIQYKVINSYSDSLVAPNGDYYDGEYGYVTIGTSLAEDAVWSTADTDPYITYSIGNVSYKLPVTVVAAGESQSSVKSLAVSVPSRIELIEGVSYGYYSSGSSYEYYLYYAIPQGTTLTAELKDGSKKVFTYDRFGDEFICDDGSTIFYDKGTYYKDGDAAWTAGGNNNIVFEYDGVTATCPVYIIDNPIQSATYTLAEPYYENCNGYTTGSPEYFYYYVGYDYGSSITLNFNNGTKKTYTYKLANSTYGNFGYVDENGNSLPYGLYPNFSTNQSATHWTVGSDNTLTLAFGNFTTENKVTIVPNPVASIEFSLVNNVYSNKDDLRPIVFQEGNTIKVNYTDSTSKVYTMKFNMSDYGFYYYCDGKRINSKYFDYNADSESGEMTVYYMGQSASAPIEYVQNDVTSIRFVPIAPITIKEKTGGRELKDGSYYYYEDSYWNKLFDDGSVMFVCFEDGTEKKYTSHFVGYTYWLVDEEGAVIDYSSIDYYPTQQQLFTPWTPIDENSLTVEYRSVMTTVPIYIDPAYDGYKGFPDVAKGAWFYNAVKFNATRGLITGYKNGKFGPADTLKRQDFVVILARIAGADLDKYEILNSKMPDVVKGSYYAAAVNWAVDNGIINGYQNGKFGVGDNITREQVCVILYRYMHSPAVTGADTTLAPFADANKISLFAKDAVVWAIQNGVISGKNPTTLAPTATASRAEIATIIMRMVQRDMFK